MEDFKKEIKDALKQALRAQNERMKAEGYLMPKIIDVASEARTKIDEIVFKLIAANPNEVNTPEDENTELNKSACATMESILDELKAFEKYIDEQTGKEE